ncbi:MAG: family acetyltransferase [Clostridiaceae bacterium]|jgi:RimJ/RimL family protein N-acetyltransferase|nr:family acetyltransferase [Clostridiaceae bacterium]
MYINNLLVGDRVKLTSLNEKDLMILENWYNDVNFLRLYDMVSAFPKSETQLLGMLNNKRSSSNSYIFAVRTIEDNTLIGVTGFEEILWNNGVATIFVGIGDRERRGAGFGREALKLTMEFGFQELNLHRIQLNVLQYNGSAINLYESLGYKKEGTYREFIHRDGKRYDMYLYGVLREEWDKLR